ncbi:hypothetical protein M9H77_11789 [Catharanthus roseus]|uniref:Uncharacterized protein n=1 Tax=Catharanthus roseus TaxID=4058 RepID=A0ACC0BFM2_CATRO|nr:hypothetical protein M9H77_11789 [Catharanthus roseus]
MVIQSLDVAKDPFQPQEEDEELLGPEVPYLSAIDALMYLANNTRPDISFAINLLERYRTKDFGLFMQKNQHVLICYADAGYLYDPHKARSQTGYLFKFGNTTISWRSTKQSITATSSNHTELIAIHGASKKCVVEIIGQLHPRKL